MSHVRPSGLVIKAKYQRTALGIAVTMVGLGALLAVLLPFRSHLSIAIPALVFVLPALIGVIVGGIVPGVVGALGGFLLYDLFFLPPYNTLTVRSPQNWTALAVYAVVVLVVSQVVAKLQEHPRGGGTPDRGVRAAVRIVAGTDRRSHAVAVVDTYGRYRAVGLRAPLDRAGPARRGRLRSGDR